MLEFVLVHLWDPVGFNGSAGQSAAEEWIKGVKKRGKFHLSDNADVHARANEMWIKIINIVL